MRNRVATLTAMTVFALALSTTPALASPATHGYMPLTGEVVACGATTYTVVSGGLASTEHLGTSASGNTNGIMTLTTRNVVVEDQNHDTYSVVGVERFGGSGNAQTGGSQETWVFKLRIVGTGDSVNAVVRFGPNGDVSFFDIGSCPLQ